MAGSINITLIFSLSRYRQVIDAYQSGLEHYARNGGDVSGVRSVASFFVSRVDTEVDRQLDAIGTPEALALRGRAAVAQAKLAYQLFRDRHSDGRWNALAVGGANVQRPLWASTSTKNPAYPPTMYVDNLIGPDTVNTVPETTIAIFEHQGAVARTIDIDLDDASAVLHQLGEVGIDMDDVGRILEDQGVTSFSRSRVLVRFAGQSHTVVIDIGDFVRGEKTVTMENVTGLDLDIAQAEESLGLFGW